MITRVQNAYACKDGMKRVCDLYGLSTDEKPLDVGNAATFYEMDTATVYMFDEQNGVWLAQ